MYLDCAPEATDDEDVTSGSVDCAPYALQCEVGPLSDKKVLHILDTWNTTILTNERYYPI